MWMTLTETNGQAIAVNMSLAIAVRSVAGEATIMFVVENAFSGKLHTIEVRESAEDITAALTGQASAGRRHAGGRARTWKERSPPTGF